MMEYAQLLADFKDAPVPRSNVETVKKMAIFLRKKSMVETTLSEDLLLRLCEQAECRSMYSDSVVCIQGRATSGYFFLLQGKIAAYGAFEMATSSALKSPERSDEIIKSLSGHNLHIFLGDRLKLFVGPSKLTAGVLGRERYSYSCVCLTDSIILVIDPTLFDNCLKESLEPENLSQLSKVSFLKTMKICRKWSESRLWQAADEMSHIRCERGGMLTSQLSDLANILIIAKGEIKITERVLVDPSFGLIERQSKRPVSQGECEFFCTVLKGRTGYIIGAIEMLKKMKVFMFTSVAVQDSEMYSVSLDSFRTFFMRPGDEQGTLQELEERMNKHLVSFDQKVLASIKTLPLPNGIKDKMKLEKIMLQEILAKQDNKQEKAGNNPKLPITSKNSLRGLKENRENEKQLLEDHQISTQMMHSNASEKSTSQSFPTVNAKKTSPNIVSPVRSAITPAEQEAKTPPLAISKFTAKFDSGRESSQQSGFPTNSLLQQMFQKMQTSRSPFERSYAMAACQRNMRARAQTARDQMSLVTEAHNHQSLYVSEYSAVETEAESEITYAIQTKRIGRNKHMLEGEQLPKLSEGCHPQTEKLSRQQTAPHMLTLPRSQFRRQNTWSPQSSIIDQDLETFYPEFSSENCEEFVPSEVLFNSSRDQETQIASLISEPKCDENVSVSSIYSEKEEHDQKLKAQQPFALELEWPQLSTNQKTQRILRASQSSPHLQQNYTEDIEFSQEKALSKNFSQDESKPKALDISSQSSSESIEENLKDDSVFIQGDSCEQQQGEDVEDRGALNSCVTSPCPLNVPNQSNNSNAEEAATLLSDEIRLTVDPANSLPGFDKFILEPNIEYVGTKNTIKVPPLEQKMFSGNLAFPSEASENSSKTMEIQRQGMLVPSLLLRQPTALGEPLFTFDLKLKGKICCACFHEGQTPLSAAKCFLFENNLQEDEDRHLYLELIRKEISDRLLREFGKTLFEEPVQLKAEGKSFLQHNIVNSSKSPAFSSDCLFVCAGDGFPKPTIVSKLGEGFMQLKQATNLQQASTIQMVPSTSRLGSPLPFKPIPNMSRLGSPLTSRAIALPGLPQTSRGFPQTSRVPQTSITQY